MRTFACVILIASFFVCSVNAEAPHVTHAVIYVDNENGSDAFDGTVARPIDTYTGPVRSIRRALQLVTNGATLEFAANATPYYDSLELAGGRCSGTTYMPFTVNGNGAIIDGSSPVPEDAWEDLGDRLWKFRPRHKGFYQLIRDNAVLPEFQVPADAQKLPAIPPGQWAAWRSAIYYQAPDLVHPGTQAIRFSHRDVGLTLYHVHDVQVRDLTFRFFRIDGISAPDLCRDVTLQGVTSYGNGRAGLSTAGSSRITVNEASIGENRTNQVRIANFSQLYVRDSTLGAPPDVIE